MVKLATQDKPFFPQDLRGKLEQARELGFDGVEADGVWLLERYDELTEAVRSTGVPVTSVCGGYHGWIGDFVDYRRRTAVEDIRLILERAGVLGAVGIVVPAAWGMFSLRLPPMTPPRPPEEDTRVLVDSLSQLEATCESSGTRVLLEPLNRYEDHMLNTLAAAAAVIEQGGLRHTGIMADFFHMGIEEASVPQSLRRWGDKVAHVHLADSHRYQPGDGHTNFVEGFEVLRDIGFSGVMAFECRVLGDDEKGAYAKSVQYIRACMQQAGLA